MTIKMLVRCWLILATAMVVSPRLGLAEDHENPYSGDPAAIEKGQRLWANAGCYTCHGETAEGALGPDLTDDKWVYRPTDSTLFKAIAMGRRGTNMVAWGGQLDPDEIWQIIAYLRSLYRGDPKKIIW